MLVGQWREVVINPPSRYRFSRNATPVTRNVEISRNARVSLSPLDAGVLSRLAAGCARCDRDIYLSVVKTKINVIKYRILAHCQSILARLDAIFARCP